MARENGHLTVSWIYFNLAVARVHVKRPEDGWVRQKVNTVVHLRDIVGALDS